MIQLKTILDVADNTGAKLASCIQMLGDSRKRYGRAMPNRSPMRVTTV